jgi:inhibitor of KinA sporulation pathway (predicted exonuclease)
MLTRMKYDKITVIDIESTCWKENNSRDINEIIEIGICPIETKSGNVLEPKSIIVKPTYSTVSEFCTELTTLTQEDVDNGISFSDACSILVNEYETKKYVWSSYGFYDRNQFEIQCERENVQYPFSYAHINVKILFALVNSLKRQVGMTDALKMLKIPLKGTHHRGGDDAQNIAQILSRILFNKGVNIV